MSSIPKPGKREGTLMYGDGDEANFITMGASSIPGFYYFKFIPSQQMRWRKNIQNDQYHPDDNTLNRIYKKELCFQINNDPDFPVWLILCDYLGNETTSLFDIFINLKLFIQKIRELQMENNLLNSSITALQIKYRKKIEHPAEDELDKLNYMTRINEATPKQIIVGQPPQPDIGETL